MSKSVFIKRNPALVYFIVVFALSWGPILILAGPRNMPINAEQSQKLLPLLYTMMLVGPGVGGILLIGLVNGKEGIRNLIIIAIIDGIKLIVGYHDHPNEMFITERHKDFAELCENKKWLKIEGPAS